MPSTTINRAPGIAFAVARPPDGRTRRSSVPWMTSVGALIVREHRVALACLHDGAQLAADSGGVVVAVEASGRHVADVLLVEHVAARADDLEELRSTCSTNASRSSGASARNRR